jgi:hypothetical protein
LLLRLLIFPSFFVKFCAHGRFVHMGEWPSGKLGGAEIVMLNEDNGACHFCRSTRCFSQAAIGLASIGKLLHRHPNTVDSFPFFANGTHKELPLQLAEQFQGLDNPLGVSLRRERRGHDLFARPIAVFDPDEKVLPCYHSHCAELLPFWSRGLEDIPTFTGPRFDRMT